VLDVAVVEVCSIALKRRQLYDCNTGAADRYANAA
jgi:hypothetical protein